MRKLILIILATVVLSGCSSMTKIRLTEDNDQGTYKKFVGGEIRLDGNLTSFGVHSRELKQDFLRRRWALLANRIIKINWREDISHFYLGAAAQGLGHNRAAAVYYYRVLDSREACGEDGWNFCHGLNVRKESLKRLRALGYDGYSSAADFLSYEREPFLTDGEKYVGEYKDGKFNGQGTFTWPSGEKYVGEWEDDKKNGQGTNTWPSGEKYVGEWKDGKRNGQGTLTYASGRKYVGEFRNDKKNGQGTYTWPNGGKYVGEFRNNKYHGQGTLTWPSGDRYVGEWEDGHKNGQGTYTWPDGRKYVGGWSDGVKHGQGTYTFADGTVKEGFWDKANNGVFQSARKVTPTVTARKSPKSSSEVQKKIARLEQEKKHKPPSKVADTSPPKINIASSIEATSDKVTIRGTVSDNGEVQQVTVEGKVVNLTSSGRFSFSRYVPPKGEQITIEAVDEWGNSSSKRVTISRVVTDNSDVVTFANLDPTRLNGRSNRNAVALVIGIADYKRAPDAVYADNDAGVFSDYARRALGISRSNIKTLTNKDANRTDMLFAIKQWLRGRIEEGKTDVYVFYAGHGLASPDGQDLYLLPYDGAPALLEDTSLKRNELFDVIANAHPRSTTVFLDTCYSGVGRNEKTLLASARPIVLSPVRQAAPPGFTVFSAASGQQISSGLDEAKHGLFSYYLMKGMEGPADANSDKKITVGELHRYVRKNVKQQSIRLGHLQVPEFQGDSNRVLVAW